MLFIFFKIYFIFLIIYHQSHSFQKPFEMTLTTKNDTIGERVRLPFDNSGKELDLVDISNTEYREIIRKAFQSLDADNNNLINSGDFSKTLTSYQRSIKKLIFEKYDLNKDKNINMTEMANAIQQSTQNDIPNDEYLTKVSQLLL
jgi:hypothetical protein